MGRWVWAPPVSGPLAPYAAGFEQSLLARGFARSAVGNRLWQVAHLSRWLEREGLSVGELTPDRVEQFLAAHRAAGYATWSRSASMRLPLEYLREVGVAPAPDTQWYLQAVPELLALVAQRLDGVLGDQS